jgi:hypothetical protein
VDFWAQHKDFVLKVLAGVGVFLVALIARSITYGDELEIAEGSNATLLARIRRTKVAPIPKIRTLEENAANLHANAEKIRDQIGWNAARRDRERDLIRRILGYLRRWKGRPASELNEAADLFRRAIQNNLNGGFGQLRLAVREALLEEAGERNIRIEGGVGYESIVELEQPELLKYLMQLELAARLSRYLIDSGVAAIEEIRIETRDLEVIPGANRAFLRAYPVRVRYLVSDSSLTKVLNWLEHEENRPWVPVRALTMERLRKPDDHILVDLTVMAVASDTGVPFEAEEKEE